MSEQNQMAISPVTAGLVGAGVGALGGATIKAVQPIQKDYKDVKNLLTMEKDSFEKISAPADDAAAEIKDNFKIIEDGRKKISEAGDAFEQNTVQPAKTEYETELNNKYGSEAEFADGTFKKGDKTIAELKTAVTTAEGKVKVEDDADVKTAQKAYDDAVNAVKVEDDAAVKTAQGELDAAKAKVDVSAERADLANLESQLAAETDATKKADLQTKINAQKAAIETKIANDADVTAKSTALENAKKAAVDNNTEVKAKNTALEKAKKAAYEKNDEVSSARKALKEAETERFTKMEEKLKAAAEKSDADDATKNLFNKVKKAKENMAKKFDAAKEADELLKDSKYGTAAEKIKGLLPRAKMKAALIGAAALAALGVAAAYIIGPKNPTPTDVA